MAVRFCLLPLLLLAVSGVVELQEGGVTMEQVKEGDAPPVFKVDLEKQDKKELSIFFGLYSGEAEPVLCVSLHVSAGDCNWTDESSPGSVSLPPSELSSHIQLYVTVRCSGCRYSLSYRYSKPFKLRLGETVTERLSAGEMKTYIVNTKEEDVRIHALREFGDISVEVAYMGREASGNQTEWEKCEVQEAWDGGVFLLPLSHGYYHIAISALRPASYQLSLRPAFSGQQGEIAMNSVVPGEVSAGKYLWYTMEVTSPTVLISIFMTEYSGDADLYVSPASPPTRKEHAFRAVSVGNEFLFISKEDRRAIGHPTGTYHLAVYGETTASFALTVRQVDNIAKPLLPGLREFASVDHRKTLQFVALLPDEFAGDVTVDLSAISGNPDLYVKRCMERRCKITEKDVLSPSSEVYFSREQFDTVTVPITAENCESPCSLSVGVYGNSTGSSRFFLDVNLNFTSLISLSTSTPYSTWLPTSSILFFKFYEPERTCESLEFVLTPISGNPDLYTSRRVKRPTKETAERISAQVGLLQERILYVKSASQRSLDGFYFLTVNSSVPSAFSLAVKEHLSSEILAEELLPGLPQDVFCPYSEDGEACVRLFSFYLSPAPLRTAIRLLLTSFRGTTRTKLTCGQESTAEETEYKWNFDSNSLSVVYATDPNYCESGLYTLLAETEMTINEPGRYRLLYTAGEPVVIGANLPLSDAVDSGVVNYYRWRVKLPQETANIKVETINGRTENYVSFSPSLMYPNATHNSLMWKGFRRQALDFSSEKTKRECSSTDSCTVFIGIKGVTRANYTLLAEESEENTIVLTVGQTVGGVSKSNYTHFLAPFKKDKAVHVFLQPLNFDVNLYVNIQAESEELQYPTATSFHFRSENSLLLSESISISPSESDSRCRSWSCSLVISVQAFSPGSRFDIAVDQSNIPVLLEAKARQGTVTRTNPLVFRFYCPHDSTNLLVSLTRLSGGDPDLYVSRKTIPSENEFEWKSTTFGSDFLVLSPSDPLFEGKSMRGFYNIAAVSRRNAEVTLSYVTNYTLPMALVPGIPISLQTAGETFSYFYCAVGKPQYDWVISLTPLRGVATVYVRTQDILLEDLQERLPTRLNYTWRSRKAGTDVTIHIDTKDPKFCKTPCNLVIGVLAGKETAEYSLVAREDIQLALIQSGVPVRGSVKGQTFDTYVYRLSDHFTPVRVTVMGLSGDIDVYGSVEVPLTASNSFNYSTTIWNLETLEVSPSLLPPDKQFLYIGVYGARGGSYVLLLTTDSERTVKVVQGWSQEYAVRYDPSDFLVFEYSGREAVCKVRTQGWRLNLDIYTLQTNSKDEVPTSDHCGRSFNRSSEEYDEYINQIAFPLLSAGRHLISVFGRDSHRHKPTEFLVFSLYCSESRSAISLTPGSEDYETLFPAHSNQSYVVPTPNVGLFEAYLSTCSGKISLQAYVIETGEQLPVLHMRDGVQGVSVQPVNGELGLTVSMDEGDLELNSASYHLATRLKKPGTEETPAIVAGSEGEIQWEATKGKLKLHWDGVKYEGGEKLEAEAVLYRVYTSTDMAPALQTYCGIRIAERQHRARRISPDDLSEPHLELDFPPASQFYLTVVAQVSHPDYNFYFSYVHYDVVAVSADWQTEESAWKDYLVWGLAAVVVICLLATIRGKIARSRQRQAESEYEMMGGRSSS